MSVDKLLDDRGSRYGNYMQVATVTEALWCNLAAALAGKEVAPDQADALRMICTKLARIVNGNPDYPDSWRDVAGYATLVAERLEGKSR